VAQDSQADEVVNELEVNTGWPVATLGDLTCEVSSRVGESETGLKVYGVEKGVGLTSTPKYVSENLARYKRIEPGMFAYNPMRLNIGSIGYCSPGYPPGAVSPDYVVFRCRTDILDPAYLNVLTQSAEWSAWVRAAGVGSVRVRIYYRELARMLVPCPSLPEQKAIAAIFGALDDKIEQNRRTSWALERLARATFQAWFVDFEPVRAKAAGAASFPGMPADAFAALPGRFEDSLLGPVPEGWEVRKAGELACFVLGGDWGKDSATVETPAAAYCIRGADIPDLWVNGIGKMPIRFLKGSSLEKRALKPGDLVVEISGGSPTQSTGRPVLVSRSLISELSHPLVCSNFCRIFRPRPHLSNFTYFLLRWMYDTEQFLQYENGTTGIKNLAFTKFCEVHDVVEPPAAILASFDALVAPLIELMAHCGAESRKLAGLRDYLLPRLLGGHVRVREAERAVQGVA
jgi:type I restriction enzyme, S subunit